MSKYSFTEELNIEKRDNTQLRKLIEDAVGEAEKVVTERLGDHLLSFLPEVELKKREPTTLHLEINLRVAPFTPMVEQEREIVQSAADTFFKHFKK